MFSAFLHYKSWRKIIPTLIVMLLATGAYFQLIDWSEKIPETSARAQHPEEQLNGIEDNTVSRKTNPLLYEWIETASFKMLNLSKDSYEGQLESNKRLFTQEGYSSYYKALQRAQIIQGLSKSEMDVVFTVNNSLIKAYRLENQDKHEWIKEHSDWIVSVPGSILYKHINKPNAFNAIVSIIVKKQAGEFKATQLIVKPE